MAKHHALMSGILPLYNRLKGFPFGQYIFTQLFCFKAPYFRSIKPYVQHLDKGIAEVSLKQRWSVQNHIKTVHAIAVCNLVEMAMGLVIEASIPSHLRWLPMGMDINYVKKATGKLTAVTKIDPEEFFKLPKYPGRVDLPVNVMNEEGTVVTTAAVKLWISEKPAK